MIKPLSNLTYVNSSQRNFANKTIDANSIEYKQSDKSTSPAARDNLTKLINRCSTNEEYSQELLNNLAKPESNGLIVGGLPDLSNSESIRHYNHLSKLFEAEMDTVEKQKDELITQGQMAGKSSQKILAEIVSLYDSQSDLFKFGTGWEGEVFAFDEFSPEGYQRTLSYS